MKSYLLRRKLRWPDSRTLEVARFVGNGVLATGIHFAILTFGIEVLHIPSAGLANFIAAFFGITASFLGNRYFVFRSRSEQIWVQAKSFAFLYVTIACFHAALLLVCTDWLKFDFRVSFVFATCLQIIISYIGNRFFVFTH
ncbi:GtrA family protein [Ensifer adhaerens]|uniref:GtrA family protein n=1 Tax=Ensifer adhaerens TaxID=106592 RepID=UPI003D04452D